MSDSRRGSIASPFVVALRSAVDLLSAAPATAGEALVARRTVRDLEQSLARLEGKEATDVDLISIACHDLKDPLASIVMGTGFLRKTIASEDTAGKRVIEAITRSTERMGNVIGDFHDLAKLEGGRLRVDLRPWDATALMQGAAPAFEAKARERDVGFEFEGAPSLIVVCDRVRLIQVLTKLVGNAVKFTGAGGRVAMRLASVEGGARVSVSDTGRGIPAERVATIFDHVANARRTPRDGPGLGLAIAQGLVLLHGSTIEVKTKVGEGSEFSFILLAPSAASTPT